jgi:uncharacterized protein YbaR (Trm112 family)
MAAKSGDPCPKCRGGRLAVASSQQQGEYQIRYLRCRDCGTTDKHVLAAAEVRRVKIAG